MRNLCKIPILFALLLTFIMISDSRAYNLRWDPTESLDGDIVGLEKWTSDGPMVWSENADDYVLLSTYPANQIFRVGLSTDFFGNGTYSISEDIYASHDNNIDQNLFVIEQTTQNLTIAFNNLTNSNFIFDNVSLSLGGSTNNDIIININNLSSRFIFNSVANSELYPITVKMHTTNTGDIIFNDLNPASGTGFFHFAGTATDPLYIDLVKVKYTEANANVNCEGDFMRFSHCNFNMIDTPLVESGIKVYQFDANNFNHVFYLDDTVSHEYEIDGNDIITNIFKFEYCDFVDNKSLLRIYSYLDELKVYFFDIDFESDRGNNGVIYGTFMANSNTENSWVKIVNARFDTSDRFQDYPGYGIKLIIGNAYLSVVDLSILHCAYDGIYLNSYADANPYLAYPYGYYCNIHISDMTQIPFSEFRLNRNGVRLSGLPTVIKSVHGNYRNNSNNGMLLSIENDDEDPILIESSTNFFNYNGDAGFKIIPYDDSPLTGINAFFNGGEEFNSNGNGDLDDPQESGFVLYNKKPHLDNNYSNRFIFRQHEYVIEDKGDPIILLGDAQHFDENENHGIYIEGRFNSVYAYGEATDYITCDSNELNGLRYYGAQDSLYAIFTQFNQNHINGTHFYSTLPTNLNAGENNHDLKFISCFANSNYENGYYIERSNPKYTDREDGHKLFITYDATARIRSSANSNGQLGNADPNTSHFAGIKSDQLFGKVFADSMNILTNRNPLLPAVQVEGIFIDGDKTSNENLLYVGSCDISSNNDNGILISKNTSQMSFVARANYLQSNGNDGILARPDFFRYFSIWLNHSRNNDNNGISVYASEISTNLVPQNYNMHLWDQSQVMTNRTTENDGTGIVVEIPKSDPYFVSHNYSFGDVSGLYLEGNDVTVVNNIVDQSVHPVHLRGEDFLFANNTIFETINGDGIYHSVIIEDAKVSVRNNIIGQKNELFQSYAIAIANSTVDLEANLFYDGLAGDANRVLSDYVTGTFTDSGLNIIDPPCMFDVLDFYSTWADARTNIPAYCMLQYHLYSYSPAINAYPSIDPNDKFTEDFDGTAADMGTFGGPYSRRRFYYDDMFLEPYCVMGVNLNSPGNPWNVSNVSTGNLRIIDLRDDFYYMISSLEVSMPSTWEIEAGAKVFVTNYTLFPVLVNRNSIEVSSPIDINGVFDEYDPNPQYGIQDLSSRVEFAFVSTYDDTLIMDQQTRRWIGFELQDGSEGSTIDYCYVKNTQTAFEIEDLTDDPGNPVNTIFNNVHLYANDKGITIEGSYDNRVFIDSLRSSSVKYPIQLYDNAIAYIDSSDIWDSKIAVYANGTSGNSPYLCADNVRFASMGSGIWDIDWSDFAAPDYGEFTGSGVNGDCNFQLENACFRIADCNSIENFGDDNEFMNYGIFISSAVDSTVNDPSRIENCTIKGNNQSIDECAGIAIMETASLILDNVEVRDCGNANASLENVCSEYDMIGGIHIYESSPDIYSCDVHGNEPTGIIIQNDSSPSITLSDIYENGTGSTPGTILSNLHKGTQVYIRSAVVDNSVLCEPIINDNTISCSSMAILTGRLMNDANRPGFPHDPFNPHEVDASNNYWGFAGEPNQNLLYYYSDSELIDTHIDPVPPVAPLSIYDVKSTSKSLSEIQGQYEEIIAANPHSSIANSAAASIVKKIMQEEGADSAEEYINYLIRQYPDSGLDTHLNWIMPKLYLSQGNPDLAYKDLATKRETATTLSDSVIAAIQQIMIEPLIAKEKANESVKHEVADKRKVRIEKLLDLLGNYDDNSDEKLPQTFALHNPWPNPFNSSLKIAFDLPESAPVNISIYDVLGREVAKLVSGNWESGHHVKVFDGNSLSSGIYFIKMETNNFNSIKRVVLLK